MIAMSGTTCRQHVGKRFKLPTLLDEALVRLRLATADYEKCANSDLFTFLSVISIEERVNVASSKVHSRSDLRLHCGPDFRNFVAAREGMPPPYDQVFHQNSDRLVEIVFAIADHLGGMCGWPVEWAARPWRPQTRPGARRARPGTVPLGCVHCSSAAKS